MTQQNTNSSLEREPAIVGWTPGILLWLTSPVHWDPMSATIRDKNSIPTSTLTSRLWSLHMYQTSRTKTLEGWASSRCWICSKSNLPHPFVCVGKQTYHAFFAKVSFVQGYLSAPASVYHLMNIIPVSCDECMTDRWVIVVNCIGVRGLVLFATTMGTTTRQQWWQWWWQCDTTHGPLRSFMRRGLKMKLGEICFFFFFFLRSHHSSLCRWCLQALTTSKGQAVHSLFPFCITEHGYRFSQIRQNHFPELRTDTFVLFLSNFETTMTLPRKLSLLSFVTQLGNYVPKYLSLHHWQMQQFAFCFGLQMMTPSSRQILLLQKPGNFYGPLSQHLWKYPEGVRLQSH